MPSARRASVSEVAGGLEREGSISCSRGAITVVDRVGLEPFGCECYGEKEFDRLLNWEAR